jgi:hypothetical protein
MNVRVKKKRPLPAEAGVDSADLISELQASIIFYRNMIEPRRLFDCWSFYHRFEHQRF